jgi:hypothetical protein
MLKSQDTQKLYGVVKSDQKHPLQEVTNIFNEYRAWPVSDRTVQRKLYETKFHKCVVKKKNQNLRLQCQRMAGMV